MLGELNPIGGGDPIPLLSPRLLVGRRSSCDICLPFPNVSSHHCELELKEGYWHIRDLGSSNGIKVNGERCTTRCLYPGDEVQIAK
ncbi:MAG: FHA domain-containing protein, partial [Planctomycetaceae bacterium]|nr:FHA domain-containing protein [Planctomycetaceae bacterium]